MKFKPFYIIVLLSMAAAPAAHAEYDFSEQSPSGHTLYFNINATGVQVSFPSNSIDQPYTSYNKPIGDLVIPEHILHAGTIYTVNSIGPHAFKGCTDLTSVTIPSTVLGIGTCAFYGCSGLGTVVIPASATGIGAEAFYMVSNIIYPYEGTATGAPWGARNFRGYEDGAYIYADSSKHVVTAYVGMDSTATVPFGVNEVAQYAFYQCTRLCAVTLAPTVKAVGDHAFAFCNRLVEIEIPDSLTSIGERAFHYCSNLSKATLGLNLRNIGDNAFSYCTKLRSIALPNTLRTVNRYAFYQCQDLSYVTLGSGMRNIGFSAFAYCQALDTITSLSLIAPTLEERAFYQSADRKQVYVPCGMTEAYTTEWGAGNSYTPIGSSLTATARVAEPGRGSVMVWDTYGFTTDCDSNTTIVATPNSGFRFSHWSDGDSTNPRHIKLTHDTLILAHFVVNEHAGIETSTTPACTIAANGRRIVINSNSQPSSTAMIYNTLGQLVARLPLNGPTTSHELQRGLYLVRIGNSRAVKIAITQ